MAAFAFAVGQRAPVALLAGLAVAVGASLPATTTGMRVLWPVLVTDVRLRAAAYAVLATQFQVAMVMGPLLVSGLLLVGGPATVLLVAGGLAGGGGLLLAGTPVSRSWRPVPGTSRRRADRTSAGVRTLIAGSVGAGAAAGMLTVGVPAAATAQHSAALAGLLFAAFSAGELLGGIAYGGVSWRWSPARRLVAAQLATAGSMASLAWLVDAPLWMLPAMFAVGLSAAPVSITNSALLDDVAPPGALARGYTVMVAAGLLGSAGGNAAGGLLNRASDQAPLFATAAALMATVALWTALRRRTVETLTPVMPGD